jgi:hypothetical protein
MTLSTALAGALLPRGWEIRHKAVQTSASGMERFWIFLNPTLFFYFELLYKSIFTWLTEEWPSPSE